MNVETIFGDFVISDTLTLNNTEIEKFCYKLRDNDSGIKVSNRNGWHSSHLKIDDCLPLHSLFNVCLTKVEHMRPLLGFLDTLNLKIKQCWVNISHKGCYMESHSHGDCFLTCVYYVKATSNSGDICFNKSSQKYSKEFLGNQSVYTEHTHKVTPTPGKLLIFPPWLVHSVEKSESDEDRISIAFNLKRV